MTTGIYILKFKGTDKVYVGQSTDIELRYRMHKTTLKNNKSSKKLQEAYDCYGMPVLEIIAECSIEELDILENQAIEIYDSVNNGFNTMSESGHRTILKGDMAGNSKYSNELVEEVFEYLVDNNLTHAEIIDITGISRGALADISSGISHKWLQEKYPAKYTKLIQLKGTTRKASKNNATTKGIVYPKIMSPDGIVYNIESLRGFCKQHNLNHGALGEVLRGFRKQHKGWKVA